MSTLKEREEYALDRIKNSPLRINESTTVTLKEINDTYNSVMMGKDGPPNSESDTRGY